MVLSNLRGILVRGPDGSGWLVSHGCRGFDRPFVGIVLLGFSFWWSNTRAGALKVSDRACGFDG